MMIRKLMLLIAAVLAPLAFAGATADITRSWARKWVEFVAAMIVSKLLLVIILSIGISVINGAGQVARPGPT
jgi:type IV secretion system protein TrbL